MTAFGISFPKLTLCRASTSKVEPSAVSTTTTATATTTTNANNTRTLSLSIKNIPSQPLQYDILTTTAKKKPISFTTILAIDGETKQLPKTLSVFNELQLDNEAGDINDKRRREETSSDIIVPSSSSPMGTVDYHSDTPLLANVDSKTTLYDYRNKEKHTMPEQRSSHTFTPPTVSLSNESSSNDLHLTVSSMSADLFQLKYAIEKFLIDDDDPIYEVAKEFSSTYPFTQQDKNHNENINTSNQTTSDLKQCQEDQADKKEFQSRYKTNSNSEVSSNSQRMSNSMKWYVSELRINRPLIYQTQWTNGQHQGKNRKLSHSVNDLKQMYQLVKFSDNGKYRIAIEKKDDITHATLSLEDLNDHKQRLHQSDDNILCSNRLCCTDDDLTNVHSDEDKQQRSPSINGRTLNQALDKDDTLIRNESVKKKLFDILNDDELENACLEDMSQEFEKISLNHQHQCHNNMVDDSTSLLSDDVFYSSPSNELQVPLQSTPPLSSSYNENFSFNFYTTADHCMSRSRLITTSLDKIPINHNIHDHSSSPYVSRTSYERSPPSWYTSPSPQWRTDDQLSMASILKKHSAINDDYLNDIDSIDPNRLLRTKITGYGIKENKYRETYNRNHQKEQKHMNYSLLNASTPLVDDSTTLLPIIQDKSSNLLMFI